MRPHRVVVLDVLTKHPPQMPVVDGDNVIEALAPERADDALGDSVGVRRAHRSQNRLDPDPSSACDEVPAIATVAVSDEEPWLLTPGGRLDHLPPDPGRDRVLRDVPVPDAAPAVVDHDEHVERAEGEGLHREQVSSPDAGRVVAQKRNSVTYAYVDESGSATPLPRLLEVDEYLDYITNGATLNLDLDLRAALEGLWSSSAVPGSDRALRDFALSCAACNLPTRDFSELKHRVFMIMLQDFMDPWTFNQKNVMKCCKEFLLPDGKQIPFCAFNSVGYREQARTQLTAQQSGRADARRRGESYRSKPLVFSL